MTSQLVALATQSRKAAGLDALELDERDDELLEPHIPISASLQLALPRELVDEVDVPKQVPHLAMMLFTAFSHRDVLEGQPLTPTARNKPATTPTTARFIGSPTKKLEAQYIAASAGWSTGRAARQPAIITYGGLRPRQAVSQGVTMRRLRNFREGFAWAKCVDVLL
jgi:hypothetical protein